MAQQWSLNPGLGQTGPTMRAKDAGSVRPSILRRHAVPWFDALRGQGMVITTGATGLGVRGQRHGGRGGQAG